MIKSTVGEMHISHIETKGRILGKRHYPTHTPIRILPDGTGWIMLGGQWLDATFYVKDVLQKLDLKDKPT